MNQTKKYTVNFFILSFLLVSLFYLDVTRGLNLFQEKESIADLEIFFQFRLPKALTALFAGAGLSLSGLLLQSLFRNPLVGPYVLGISSGASLGVSLMILFGGYFSVPVLGMFGLSLAAISGSLLMLFLVLFFAGFMKQKTSLLLIGIMLGQLTGAMQSLLDFIANPTELKSIFMWNMGSLDNVGWDEQINFIVICSFCFLISLFLIKPLDALLLGEEYAVNLGVKIKKIRWMLLIVSGVLTGIITSLCGPIAFVGIAVPHICRMWFATNRHVVILPAVLVSGAVFLLVADLISCSFFSFIIPINVITSIIGVPVIIALILKTKNLN